MSNVNPLEVFLCEEGLQLLQRALEKEMESPETEKFAQHIGKCEQCRAGRAILFLERLRKLIDIALPL